MSKSNHVAAPPKRVDEQTEHSVLFGPPPLIEGEDAAVYYEFHAKVSTAVKPKDFVVEILARDVVDLSWEILRLRRINASLVSKGRPNLVVMTANIDAIERIDRMIMNAEARRNAALREIERHRSCVAEALRRATDDVVDAEFEDVAQDEPDEEVARDELDDKDVA